MERQQLPDAVNCSTDSDFTQIPNNLIRNPNISTDAKTILCILLSNKSGWKSHGVTLKQMMKEGRDAIQNGLKELEKFGYLKRIKYRSKQTKTWVGSFWAYTDMPFQFNIKKHIQYLLKCGFEPQPENQELETTSWKPIPWKSATNNTNNNNTNKKYSSLDDGEEQSFTNKSHHTNGFITKEQFDKFWQLYPRKDGKGKALKSWNDLCSQKSKECIRPKWDVVETAIIEQKKSERWECKEFIPLPATWLNQTRWIDDPNEMKTFKRNEVTHNKPKYKYQDNIRYQLCEDGEYRHPKSLALLID